MLIFDSKYPGWGKNKPQQWGPQSAVQSAMRHWAEQMGINPAKLLLYMPVWEGIGIPHNYGLEGSATLDGPVWSSLHPNTLYFDGTDDRIDILLSKLYDEPVSLLFYGEAVGTSTHTFLSIADKDSASQQHRLQNNFAHELVASSYDGTLSEAQISPDTAWVDKLVTFAAVFEANNSRTLMLADADGAFASATNTDTRNISGLDRITIGTTADSTPNWWLTGYLHSALVITDILSETIVQCFNDTPYALAQPYIPPLYFDVGVGAVTSDFATVFDIRNQVNSDFATKYDLFNTVSSDFAIKYDLLNSIFSDFATTYDIRQTAQGDFAVTFDIGGAVNSSFTVTYDLLNSVTSDFDIVYGILNSVFSSFGTVYDIYETAQSDFEVVFDINNIVQSDFQVVYDMAGQVFSDFEIVYDITTVTVKVKGRLRMGLGLNLRR